MGIHEIGQGCHFVEISEQTTCFGRGPTDDAARVGKDAGAGKATFVSLLGEDRARQQAGMLVDQAIEHLDNHQQEADLMRAIASYVMERDR